MSWVKHTVLKYISELVPSMHVENFGKIKSTLAVINATNGKISGDIELSCEDETVTADLNGVIKNKDKIVGGLASEQINIQAISDNGRCLHFEIGVKDFIKRVIRENPTDIYALPERKKILVEFSSPNIAKEFHVGHFRSTVIGNFIANIKKKLGNDVVKINYLGDWGTQFGHLIIGIKLLKFTDESLNTDTIQKLNDAYVMANRLALKDEKFHDEARQMFEKLEKGDQELLDLWAKVRTYSIKELDTWYKKLNISFDEIAWESSYNKTLAEPFMRNLEDKGLVSNDDYGRKVFRSGDKEIPLFKSDGTTLYLSRDIMAYLDRRSRHNFDNMYYVVDTGQAEHFQNLKKICEKIEDNGNVPIRHVKFGRISNMSTRKGSCVLLRDLFEEARDRMYEKTLNTATTKGTPNLETSGIIGAGALVVNDLRRSRKVQYDFNWDKALMLTGKSGVQLQYAHCRLSSLHEFSGATLPDGCDPDLLTEPEALELVLAISRYEEALSQANEELESRYLVQYLFELMKSINRSLRKLGVKGSEQRLGSQRLLLFDTARKVMADGLRLLGVTVLQRM